MMIPRISLVLRWLNESSLQIFVKQDIHWLYSQKFGEFLDQKKCNQNAFRLFMLRPVAFILDCSVFLAS